MELHKEFIYSYGDDERITKFNFKTKTLDTFLEAD
jgi:hypothetical protein